MELLRQKSNPERVQHNLNSYFGKPTDLYVSTRKNKKYMIRTSTGWVHFGDTRYADYTKHQDEARRYAYIQRAINIRGNWKADPYSANNLSLHVLWEY